MKIKFTATKIILTLLVLFVLLDPFARKVTYEIVSFMKDSASYSIFNPFHYFPFNRNPENFYSVEDGKLYRSKQLTKDQLEKCIKEYGIRTIINLRPIKEDEIAYNQELEIIQKYDIKYVSAGIACSGSLPSQEKIRLIFDTLNNAPKPILIHCKAGADRTGLASALWILSIQKKSLEEALQQQIPKYNHIKRYIPYMRLFTKIWAMLLEEHGNSEEALKHYNPDNYPRAFYDTINELSTHRLLS